MKNSRTWIALAVFLAAASCPQLFACGPAYPNRYLLNSDEVLVRTPVIRGFSDAILQLTDGIKPEFLAVPADGGDRTKQTTEAKTADLAQAKASQGRLSRLFRRNKTPAEFALYEAGAAFYHKAEHDKAITQWLKVLDLPAKERPYRSTWAAYMIGRTLLAQGKPDESTKWFEQTRSLARDGFADSLGLAAASYGWQGRAALDRSRYEQAFAMYLQQMAAGDATAYVSLYMTAEKAHSKSPEALAAAARDAAARRLITAYMVSRALWRDGGVPRPGWIDALEAARLQCVEDADLLALAAYRTGRMELAQRWLAQADKQSLITQWLTAKLLLRDGKIDEAADILARLAVTFEPVVDDPPRKLPWDHPSYHKTFYDRTGMRLRSDPVGAGIRGELGVLRLCQGQYIEALSILLEGGHWMDAAYIADYVLTLGELKLYVDRHWPATCEDTRDQSQWTTTHIRHLMARRLARCGRFEDARPYYPDTYRKRLDVYTAALRQGRGGNLSQAERADHLWKAAQIACHEGMQLMGTELAPDSFCGVRDMVAEYRNEQKKETIAPGSPDELQRLETHLPEPNKKWHYQYQAAELAWEAAALMPNNSDRTAEVLCLAGSWLKADDPQAADRFYKALVIRCRKTALGAEADKLRWFPEMPRVDYTPPG